MPVLLVVVRVGAGGVDLSVSDVVLFIAFWPAVAARPAALQPAAAHPALAHRRLPGVTLFTVVANPFTANTVEWFHAWLLTGGALIVGWALGRAGRGAARADACCWSRHASSPWPPSPRASLHLAGASTRSTPSCRSRCTRTSRAPCSASRPSSPTRTRRGCAGHAGWPSAAFVLCTGGHAVHPVAPGHRRAGRRRAVVVAPHGRDPAPLQAARPRRRRRRSRFVATLVRDQIDSGNQFNSVFQRLNWFQDSIDVWLNDPIFGVGLRWWYTDRFPSKFQPPNAELEVLTTAGVVGLLAFRRRSWSAPSWCCGGSTRCTARSRSRRRAEPVRPGPVRPVLGRGPGVDAVRHRRHLPRRAARAQSNDDVVLPSTGRREPGRVAAGP